MALDQVADAFRAEYSGKPGLWRIQQARKLEAARQERLAHQVYDLPPFKEVIGEVHERVRTWEEASCTLANAWSASPVSVGGTRYAGYMTPIERIKHVAEQADVAADELLEFLDSPTGRRLRNVLAGAVIVSVPLIMRIPGLKRSPLGRLVAITGGSAILVGIAEAIRDWERTEKSRARPGPVIDVPPASGG